MAGGHTSIIEPLRGPTCKLEQCKISRKVEIPSWTECGKKLASLRRLNMELVRLLSEG